MKTFSAVPSELLILAGSDILKRLWTPGLKCDHIFRLLSVLVHPLQIACVDSQDLLPVLYDILALKRSITVAFDDRLSLLVTIGSFFNDFYVSLKRQMLMCDLCLFLSVVGLMGTDPID